MILVWNTKEVSTKYANMCYYSHADANVKQNMYKVVYNIMLYAAK